MTEYLGVDSCVESLPLPCSFIYRGQTGDSQVTLSRRADGLVNVIVPRLNYQEACMPKMARLSDVIYIVEERELDMHEDVIFGIGNT